MKNEVGTQDRAITNQTQAIEIRILQALGRHGPQSRAQLARRLGVMRSTVGGQVTKLFDSGLLCTGEAQDQAQSGAGRPGSAIDFNPHHRSFMGIDLSIGHLRSVLTDLRGNILAETNEAVAVADQTPERMSRKMAHILSDMRSRAPALDGVTISVPGLVNNKGTIVRLPFLDWQDVKLRDLLYRELPDFGPIDIDNDANIFAKGELLSSDDLGKSFIYFWMDAGIGAGIAVNGTLLVGQNGQAGEIGHIFVRTPTGADQSRLDSSAGMTTLVQQAQSAGLDVSTITDFMDYVRRGEPATDAILGTWTSVLSETLSSLASIFDPKAMVFSGPLTALMESVLSGIEDKTKSLLLHGTVMPSIILRDHDDLLLARSCVKVRRDAFLGSAAHVDRKRRV